MQISHKFARYGYNAQYIIVFCTKTQTHDNTRRDSTRPNIGPIGLRAAAGQTSDLRGKSRARFGCRIQAAACVARTRALVNGTAKYLHTQTHTHAQTEYVYFDRTIKATTHYTMFTFNLNLTSSSCVYLCLYVQERSEQNANERHD